MHRSVILLFSLLVGTGLLEGAQPRISNIKYSGVDHASIRWTFTVDHVPVYVQVLYGVSPNVYPYASVSYQATTDWYSHNMGSIAIGGLEPNTTYYFRMTARPNRDDDIDICNTDECGSIEQSVTTGPEPTVHAALPSPPAVYRPAHPDTSNYAVVPMMAGPNGDCVAAAAVGSVGPGDPLPAIFSKIGFGTVIEFPQGAVCKVIQRNDKFSTGYELPALPLDAAAGGDIASPNHRWIVLRTKSERDADFPPFGVRVTPAWATKMARLEAYVPGTYNGQIFSAAGQTNGTYGAHHIWIENLELTTANDLVNNPPDAVNPKYFPELIKVGPAASGSGAVPNATPQYVVLDRLYLHTGPFPARTGAGVTIGGKNVAMIGCYTNFDYWRMAAWPTSAPTLDASKTVLSIPQSTYRRNIADAPIGMAAPATATLTAPAGTTGKIAGFLGPDGLTIQFSAGEIACEGCAAVPAANPAAPVNRYAFFTADIANGVLTNVAANTQQWQTAPSDWNPISLQISGGGPTLIENNSFQGSGMSVYIDPGWPLAADDVVFRRNHIFWSQTQRRTSPTWDGFGHDVRNQFEVKRGHRWLVDGNVMEGQWSYQNAGMFLMLLSTYNYDFSDLTAGTTDFSITNNVFRHGAMLMSCSSSQPQVTGADGYIGSRILMQNNLAYDLNRYTYNDNGPGYFSGGYVINQSCQDFIIRNNTFGLATAPAPDVLVTGGGRSLVEGFDMTSNIFYLSYGAYGGIRHSDTCADAGGYGCITSHPRLPKVTGSTYKELMDSYFVRTGQKITTNYRFSNNVIIGGQVGRTADALRDMTAAELATYATQFPAGNFFPAGNSVAEREASVGFTDVGKRKYSLSATSPYKAGGAQASVSGSDVGMNQDVLDAAIGLVKNIQKPDVGWSGAIFTYTAPDGNACWVDTSVDAQTWSRLSDGGGIRSRRVAVGGLAPRTTYYYRILCLHEQVNDGFVSTDYAPDELTNGTFRTTLLSRAQRTERLQVSPPSVVGSARVVGEYGGTPALGGVTAAASCAGECLVNLPAIEGELLFYRWKYIDTQGSVVATGPVQVVLPR